MNKTQLIDIVAKKTGMTKTETEFLLTVALETIVDAVEDIKESQFSFDKQGANLIPSIQASIEEGN